MTLKVLNRLLQIRPTALNTPHVFTPYFTLCFRCCSPREDLLLHHLHSALCYISRDAIYKQAERLSLGLTGLPLPQHPSTPQTLMDLSPQTLVEAGKNYFSCLQRVNMGQQLSGLSKFTARSVA